MVGDRDWISAEIEHTPQPRDDRRQSRKLGESYARPECVSLRGLDSDASLHAVQLHRSRVAVRGDDLDASDGPPTEEVQCGPPVVRRLIAQQKLDLAARSG